MAEEKQVLVRFTTNLPVELQVPATEVVSCGGGMRLPRFSTATAAAVGRRRRRCCRRV
jgi:hypothetical protein